MNQLSYSRNTEEYSFIYDTIGSRIRHWSQTQPNKTALVVHMGHEKRATLTFGELYDKAVKLAKYYLSLGVKPGDRIAVFVYNSPEWLVASVACSLAGAVVFNSFTFAAETDLDVVRTFECKVLVADMRYEKVKFFLLKNLENLKQKGFSVHVVSIEDENAEPSRAGAKFDVIMSNKYSEDIQLPDVNDPEEITAVFQTSGSTGVPKLIPQNHLKLINCFHFLYTKMDLKNEDVFFNDRPMGYVAGYPMPVVVVGCTFVTLNSQETVRGSLAGNVCTILKEENVTSGYFPPYLIYDLEKLKLKSPDLIPSLNSAIVSGQRLSKKVLQQFQEYATNPCTGYGLSEVGWVTLSRLNDLPDLADDVIGSPIPGIEMKIIDEDGNVVPDNTPGEICLRDACMEGKYLKSGGKYISFRDDRGWLHSGDIGYMLNDGKNFCIKGRVVEMIKRATIKIFPATVETVFSQNPAIAEVVVVGIPDERLHQEVCACVTVRAGKEITVAELEAFAIEHFRPDASPDGKGLMPGYFFIFDSFPRLPSQKVNRRKIAEMAKELAVTKLG